MICGFGALRSRVAKAAGQHRNGKLRVACREARVQLKIQNAKKLMVSDHFLKFRCRRNARRCGAKHISKSKSVKNLRFGALLEASMSQRCPTEGQTDWHSLSQLINVSASVQSNNQPVSWFINQLDKQQCVN